MKGLWYQYEGVEAGLFFLPVFNLVQSPRLVAAEPGGQLLEPLALRALELEHIHTVLISAGRLQHV